MIPRIPLPPSRELLIDEDIETAYNWFKKFIGPVDWENRKAKIEEYLSTVVVTGEPFSKPSSEGTLLVIQRDQIAWYMYLIHTYLYEPHKYEYYQGARIVPIFKRIGMEIELLSKIEGIDKKVKDLFKKRPMEADAILFEILTALLWARNGWNVTILEEGKGGKSPDFEVTKGLEKWQVECKRQTKTADYTYRETKKRQIMISAISRLLMQYNILLDIVFHEELEKFPDTFLYDILKDIIPSVKKSGTIISNETVEIKLSFIDMQSIQNHLKKYDVKNNSPQLQELITKKHVDHSAFTSGFIGSYFYYGDGEANNLYINDMTHAFGVHCYCDAPDAVSAKARDVKNQIHSAISQFNPTANSIIHIGMETYDGPEVEMKRNKKIMETMAKIDPTSNMLCWIFFHYFQSYTRSDETWYFDETVKIASSYIIPVAPPIKQTFLIVPENDVPIDDANHWDKDLPK